MRLQGGKIAAILLVAALTWVCGRRPTTTAPVPPEDPPPQSARAEPGTPEPPSGPAATPARDPEVECALIAEPGEPIITIALGDRIDPANAPHPTNESERILFRQLYETLVRVDCNGRARPGLAASWQLDANGRTWIVTLGEDARFADGTPVTARDVHASWTDGQAGVLRPPVSLLVESIAAIDDRTLAITLRRQRVDAPFALAHTDLAVAKRAADSPWPIGTRSLRATPTRDASGASAGSVVTLEREGLSPLRFLVSPGDPRDFLDKGVDLLLTRDPTALDYAATLPHFQSVPLEWQRTHVFLSPGRARSSSSLSEDQRQALAGDAIRGEARGAVGPFWWQTVQDCTIAAANTPPQASPNPRIVYDARDAVARDLAERLVALVRTSRPEATAILDALLPEGPRRRYQRATGLTGESLAVARRRGADAGYIVSVDRRPLDPCRDLQVITGDIRWLDPETIVPLVETRLHAVVRRGRSGVTADWDGGLHIAGMSASQ